MRVRRVVTGHDANGKSRVVSDEVLERQAVGGRGDMVMLWRGDAPPSFPSNGKMPECPMFIPSLGGFRFLLWTVAPDREAAAAAAQLDAATAAAAMEDLQREIGSLGSGERSNMHTTDTVDFEVVLSGEIWVELDDGEEVHLKAGDTFIQNGTRHLWRNRGTEPARIALIMIGGHPR